MKQGRTVLEAKRFGCYTSYHDAPLVNVAQRMVNEDISCVVIVDHDGYLVGIITRNDMLRDYLENDAWQQVPAGNYMTSDVITVAPEDTLRKVADLLLEHHIHRVVVVRHEDGKQKPLAVISDSDLVYHMMKEVG